MSASGRRRWVRATMAFAVCAVSAAAGLALPAVPSAQAALPVQVDFTLTGCNRPVGLVLPRPDGKFICPDANYTPGNQGSNWAELDLVPFRLTTRITPAQMFTVNIAADSEEGGSPGYDVISAPVLNQGLSGPDCQAPQVGAQRVARPGVGGTDASLVRELVIPSSGDETCVYDWYQRLALGSSGFPGASLQTRIVNEDLESGGIGQKTVSMPVNGLAPQSISKQIKAARGDGYLWTLSKTSVPATVGVDTCTGDRIGAFTTTIRWDRTPVTGDVTWTSQVFATNPSSRVVQVRITDVVSANGQVVDTTTGPVVSVPALSTGVLVLSHSGTAPAGTTSVSDVATATYTDAETGVAVPGNSTASASAPVSVSAATNPTATITDVTTANSPISLESMSSGTAEVPPGTPVSTPITWRSGTVSTSGTATLTFASVLPPRSGGTVTVDDTATLLDGAGRTVTATQSSSVQGQPAAPRITFVKTVDVPPTEDATFYFSLWLRGPGGNKTTVDPVVDGPVTIPAGAGSSSSTEVSVPPSPNGYIYEENPAPGYATPPPGTLGPMDVCDTLDGTVENTRLMGSISVSKVAEGDAAGADPTATVHVDCDSGTTYDQDLTVSPGTPAVTDPIPTGTSCTVTEPDPPDGYDLVGISPGQVTVTEGPDPVAVTVTNRRSIGQLRVTKEIVGAPSGASTTFTVHADCDPGAAYDRDVTLTVTPPATEASSADFDIPVGVSCTVTEPDVPPGWALSGITPNGGLVTIGDELSDVRITDTRVHGSLVVTKHAEGAVSGAETAFTVQVSCTDGFTATPTLTTGADGYAQQVLGPIPSGSTCTVSEDDVPDGWTLEGIDPETVVIGDDPDQPVAVTVTNRRGTGAIQVVKEIEGQVAGAGTDFTVHIDCPGTEFDTDVSLTVPDAREATVPDLPTGMVCAVTEPDPGPDWSSDVEPESVTVGDAPVTVTVTNTRAVGAVRVTKRLDGPVAGATTSFDLTVSCPEVGLDQGVTLDTENGLTEVVEEIPTGVTCTVTEDQPPAGWTLDTIEPGQVVVASGDPVEVVATNRRDTGRIAVTKSLVGPVDGAPTTFSAQLDCDDDAYDQALSVTVQNGVPETVQTGEIPTGMHCVFTEVNIPPQWELGGVASPDVIVDGTETVVVNAVNTRRTGALRVVKTVDGPAPTSGVSFDLALDCSDNVFDTLVPVDMPAGETTVTEAFSGIPTGVTCQVTETALPDGWVLSSIEPAEVTIADDPSTVTVTNTFEPPPPPPEPAAEEGGRTAPPAAAEGGRAPQPSVIAGTLGETGLAAWVLPLAALAVGMILSGLLLVASAQRLSGSATGRRAGWSRP